MLPGEAGLALDHHPVPLGVGADAVDHLPLRHRLRTVLRSRGQPRLPTLEVFTNLQFPGGSGGGRPGSFLAHLDCEEGGEGWSRGGQAAGRRGGGRRSLGPRPLGPGPRAGGQLRSVGQGLSRG